MYEKDEIRKKFMLRSDLHSRVGNVDKVDYFGRAYTFFNANRNRLFHSGDPSLMDDQTAVIENIGIAKDKIKDSIKIIDEYYRL